MEKRELKEYVSGKNVLIVSTERTFCEYTYEILLEIGRYARKQEMIESSCKSALIRKLWIRARLAFRNKSDIDVIVVCARGDKEHLPKNYKGKTVVRVDEKWK